MREWEAARPANGLRVPGRDPDDLWSPLGNVCQEWDVSAVGSHYTISNVGNGMVLDAENCGTANGTVVRQCVQLDNDCQQWDIKS